jgi:large subunit ribosomal protein L3
VIKIGHFNKNNISLKKYLKEFKIEDDDLEGLELGKEFDVKIFEEGQLVDVSGISKGKGFAGTVKRWNFATQDATHGNSLAHRKPGSIGQCQTPGRVWKGKKMAGHMGNVKKTVQNLKIVKVDEENSLLLVQGAIPGFNGSSVIIKPAIKA